MTNEKFLEEIKNNFKEAYNLVCLKNKDYSKIGDPFSNFRSSLLINVDPRRAILIRICDKIARISNLLDKESSVKDDPITDDLLDCLNYFNILKVWLDENKLKYGALIDKAIKDVSE